MTAAAETLFAQSLLSAFPLTIHDLRQAVACTPVQIALDFTVDK
jgi:hypothetical protein